MNNNGADRKNVFPSATGIVLKIGLCVDPETQLKRPWIAITFTSVGGDVLDLDNVGTFDTSDSGDGAFGLMLPNTEGDAKYNIVPAGAGTTATFFVNFDNQGNAPATAA